MAKMTELLNRARRWVANMPDSKSPHSANMIDAWLAGYRAGKNDAKKEAKK